MQAVAKKISSRDLQALLKQQSGAAAAANPLASISPADVATNQDDTSVIRLDVFQVQPFKGNPRTESNEKRAEIRESIRTSGLQQKIHVCKHPTDGYITARGGCTRLVELHTLASEKDEHGQPTQDAKRFAFMDFILVPYTKDSDLLVHHLSENLQRSDMSFWDTAAGVMQTRRELEIERRQEIGLRELEQMLRERGLSIERTLLNDYSFALDNLSMLPISLRHRITRNDVRQILRPGQTVLSDFWQRHGQQDQAAFLQNYCLCLELFSQEAEADFTADALQAHIQAYIGTQLGYESEAFAGILGAFKLDKNAPLADLVSLPNTEHLEAIQSSTHPSDIGQDGSTDPSFTSDTTVGEVLVAGFTPPTDASVPSSLKVASGLVSKAEALRQAQEHPTPQVTQEEFAGMNPADIALAQLQARLQAIAELVGLSNCLHYEPRMPSGFFMDLPEVGHIGNAQDLAAQGWWLLACLSGQLGPDMTFLPQGSAIRQAMETHESFEQALAQNLGGQALDSGTYLAQLLTSANQELAQPAIELVQAMHALSLAKTQSPKEELV